jgi:hypothetical protein
MEPGVLSPRPKEPATCPYFGPDQTSPGPYPISWRSLSILSSHLHSGLPKVCFLQVSPPKLCMRLFFPIRTTWPAHLILLHFIIRIIFCVEYRLCSLLKPHVTSSLLGPNFVLGNPFSNILSLCSSPCVRHQVSYPHKTTGIITEAKHPWITKT